MPLPDSVRAAFAGQKERKQGMVRKWKSRFIHARKHRYAVCPSIVLDVEQNSFGQFVPLWRRAIPDSNSPEVPRSVPPDIVVEVPAVRHPVICGRREFARAQRKLRRLDCVAGHHQLPDPALHDRVQFVGGAIVQDQFYRCVSR